MTSAAGRASPRAGWMLAAVVGVIYGGIALTVDFPSATGGFFSDAATYYLMGHSLASDGDLEYRSEDLSRVRREFASGPRGVFLKRGVDVSGVRLSTASPFVVFGEADPNPDRLYYGKSFIYPLVASPFVRLFGTNGFLVLNAALLVAAFLLAYSFIGLRTTTAPALLLASAFVFATVVPVYAVWIMPELLNLVLGMGAYHLWLRKHAVNDVVAGRTSDLLAAALGGVATFSKVTNAIMMVPFVGWLLWKRQWERAVAVSAVWAAITVGLFGVNVAVTGEWNYQGGDRHTCYEDYPFQQAGVGLEICDERGRDEALNSVIFDREVFWTNLRANLGYFVIGRNAGLVAYFFPAVFGTLALVLLVRRSHSWQWFVLLGVVLQVLVLLILLPYTFFGGGGSVGNRYFMGAYGLCVFLIPPIRSTLAAAVPWFVGSLFMAGVLMHPFVTSVRPGDHSGRWPLRLLPPELTNVNDLPINTDQSRVRIWYGENEGLGDRGFQVYYLDDNAYLKEADPSFWIRGESRAEVLLKADFQPRWLQVRLRAGPVASVVEVGFGGRAARFDLPPNGAAIAQFQAPPGFPYKQARETPVSVWVLSISSSTGFTPSERDPTSPDDRYLGVRVRPILIE